VDARGWEVGSVCSCLRYKRCMVALSWLRAISASVGVRWGSAMSSSGNRGLSGGLLKEGAVGFEVGLCVGFEGIAGLCGSSSLSLDGRSLQFFRCGGCG